jgi:hypothetical protein
MVTADVTAETVGLLMGGSMPLDGAPDMDKGEAGDTA